MVNIRKRSQIIMYIIDYIDFITVNRHTFINDDWKLDGSGATGSW